MRMGRAPGSSSISCLVVEIAGNVYSSRLSASFSAGVSDAKVYIGSAPLAGPYTYFVDDLVLTQIDAEEGSPITPSPGIAPGGYPNPTTAELATARPIS
jgi:hypothetical protein